MKGLGKDFGEAVFGRNRFERGFVPNKNITKGSRRSSLSKIINKSLRDLRKEGEDEGFSGFTLVKGDFALTPVNILDPELANIRRPHSISGRKQKNSIVPPPRGQWNDLYSQGVG